MKKYKMAVVGASGLVGRTILKVLEERDFPIASLRLLASSRSAGSTLPFRGRQIPLHPLREDSFEPGLDIALFSAGAEVSRRFGPLAASQGALVVDNSSCWRMDPAVPLIVPEVNPQDFRSPGLIANPNCSTIQCMAALHYLDVHYGLRRVIFTTFQAASGAGRKGLDDLEKGTTTAFNHPLVRNVIPQIDDFLPNGYTREEMKMVNESRKILHHPGLAVTATAVRVPVDFGHTIAVNVELERDFELDEIREGWAAIPGIIVKDEPEKGIYPTPLDCKGKDNIYLGRIRRDLSIPRALSFITIADNIRKGAATNTVQIAELLKKEG